MSATNRGTEREIDDFYRTPDWCIDLILDHLPMDNYDQVIDLGCGTGAIGNRILHRSHPGAVWAPGERSLPVVGIDISVKRGVQCHFPVIVQDVLTTPFRPEELRTLVIMNPPFKHALEFVKAGLSQIGTNPYSQVAALLRLNWLGAQERAPFHQEHPAEVNILPRRPNFKAGQVNPRTGRKFTGDATEYAWFVWGSGRDGTWRILT